MQLILFLLRLPKKLFADYIVLNKVGNDQNFNAREFLEADLRIDQDQWKKFNPNVLCRLNKFYRNKNIENLLEIL